LADPSGAVVVETHRPGGGWRAHRARLEQAGHRGPWFRWAEVGADAIDDLGHAAGLAVERVDVSDDEARWFAVLRPRDQRFHAA